MVKVFAASIHNIWNIKKTLTATCDFQQFGILTSVDSDKSLQPPFKRMRRLI